MNTKRVWETRVNESQSVSALSDVLLSELVTELDSDTRTRHLCGAECTRSADLVGQRGGFLCAPTRGEGLDLGAVAG